MFGRFSKQHWRRRSTRNRRSAFGGTVKSMEEIAALNEKISEHEKRESHIADTMLDSEWEKVEKKPKN
jgi:hypothetical protein